MRAIFIVLAVLFFVSRVFALNEDPSYRGELSQKVKKSIEAVASASGDVAKLVEVKKLKDEVESERDRIRRELDDAKDAKAPDEKLTRLDGRDTEILKVWFSLEPVFDQSLSPSYAKNAEFKRKACVDMPAKVKFNDMAALPDDASTPASTALALDLVKALCDSKSAGAASAPAGTATKP